MKAPGAVTGNGNNPNPKSEVTGPDFKKPHMGLNKWDFSKGMYSRKPGSPGITRQDR
jgi:hypothetical protein